ncbi:MAG: DEAD/DEAH box helicase [Niabella sp.]
MATANTKTFLLFQPALLFSKKPSVSIRQLIKAPKGLTTGEQPFSRPHIKTFFRHYDDETVKALLAFAPAALQKVNMELHKQTDYITDQTERNAAIKKAYTRHLYALAGALRRLPVNDLYHPVPSDTNRIQNVKCSFHPYPVELIFTVAKTTENYHIDLFVEMGKDKLPFQDFNRFEFLLEKENRYYQMSPKSYEALEWLYHQDVSKWPAEDAGALELVLQGLGDRQVKIDRTAFSELKAITVLPEQQVLLSELSNTFLKLEPQFVYDGITIDGPYEPITKIETGNKIITISRNQEQETALTDFLRSLHEKFANQNNGFFYLTFAEAQKKGWFLKTYHLLLEKNINLLGIDLLKHFRYSPHKAETLIKQQTPQGDFVCIEFSLKFGKETVSLNTLQKSLLNNQKAILLKDGSLGVLGDDWIKQYGLMIRHGKIRNSALLVAKWLILGAAAEKNEDSGNLINTDIAPAWFSKWQQWEKQEAPVYPLPANLRVKELRSYQRTGYEWLRLLAEIGASGCLADDMGLGKTLQTISFLMYKIEAVPEGKHLVVAPASLLYNWLMELEKFAPHVKATVLHGSKRDTESLAGHNYQVIITSYGTMRQDIQLLETVTWETIVLDESHHIKNPGAQTTKAAWQLSAKTKIALSGTPVMNSTGDLHSQMHFLMPGLLGTPEFFKKEYTLPIEQLHNEEKAAALQKLIRPFVLRRTKEQVASDLPERTESFLWCEMDADQRAAYESIKETIRANIFTEINSNGLNKGKLSVLAGLTKLRQLCNSCELVKNEDIFTYDSVKTKVLIHELQCIIPQHRALVFSQFTSMLDLLERDLGKAGIPALRLDGQTAVKQRQELVTAFQSETGTAPVFLISLKAGNTGLTLTKADYVFLFDPWWNTAVENQAIDRTHRIGQQQHVFAYRMICRNSIEEKIIKLAGRKKKLADDLITTEESLIKGLSLEDIKYLLE